MIWEEIISLPFQEIEMEAEEMKRGRSAIDASLKSVS